MATARSQSPVDPPLVSIIVPVYNGARTIAITLESLASQDYPRTEWIVIDDASDDDSARTVELFQRQRGMDFTFIRHEVNQGIARTWNRGMKEAVGRYALIVHQDVELQGTDWITRAVSRIEKDKDIAVVTCYYGIPDSHDLTYVMRAFGFLRQQFHRPPERQEEYVTFSEFKCDLVRQSVLLSLGGFPEGYDIGGQDIAVSFSIRRNGWKIVKVYGLRTIQRFSGQAETFLGNLSREFSFGMGNARVLSRFRTFAFRDLGGSKYGASRLVNRAFQPLIASTVLTMLIMYLISASVFPLAALVIIVMGRIAFQAIRLWPDFRGSLPTKANAIAEALTTGFVGLISDFVFACGTVAGFLRHLMDSVSARR